MSYKCGVKKQPPTLLGNAIERQQLIPRDFVLPEFDLNRLDWDYEMGMPIYDNPYSLGWNKSNANIFRLHPQVLNAESDLQAIIGSLPARLRQYLRKQSRAKTRGERFYSLADVYVAYCEERRALLTILFASKNEGSALEIPSVRILVKTEHGKRLAVLRPQPLYTEIVNEEVDLSYVRECANPKCRLIFWAVRCDQTGHKKGCGQAIRDKRRPKKGRATQTLDSFANTGIVERFRSALLTSAELTKAELMEQAELTANQFEYCFEELNKEHNLVKLTRNVRGETVFRLSG
jgi:hypothetical protein